jgi:hypothetical protein
MALLNSWLLGGYVESFLEIDINYEPGDLIGAMIGFAILLAMLVVFEIPLATAFVTLYLSKAVFEETPSAKQIFRDFWNSLPQLLLFQVFLRSLLIPFVITWFIPFAFWPYLSEVILLERNPLRRSDKRGLSTMARSFALHSASGGDLFGRWMASVAFGLIWMLALWAALFELRLLLTGRWMPDAAFYLVYLQLAIWIIVGYFSVVRFLTYLDSRIRTEGWEVELRLRAEAARLARRWETPTT